ncbi:MAG: hypothetical protein HQL88_07215 [Magnetococcales bacterium]|nr:hypothetical protein [Magnetococcales bacterium]
MAMQLTPERITELLLEFSMEKLRTGTPAAQVEQELMQQGAHPDVAKLLVSRAAEGLKPT